MGLDRRERMKTEKREKKEKEEKKKMNKREIWLFRVIIFKIVVCYPD